MTSIVTHAEFNGMPASREHEIKRATAPELDPILGWAFPVLDHGFVRIIDYMGNQDAIVQAARVSYGAGTKTGRDSRSLLRYLLRHMHTSPFEMCEIKLHVKLPIFVARQWIRHRTANVNEYSARYSLLSREFHMPEGSELAPQSSDNKQGRSGDYTETERAEILRVMEGVCDAAFNVYEELVEEGGVSLARESARAILPLSTYTEWYWKVDLHNLLHFLKLRMHAHAQLEIRLYAETIYELISAWVPDVVDAYDEYVYGAHTFSAREMAVLECLLSRPERSLERGDIDFLRETHSDREISAFRATLKL